MPKGYNHLTYDKRCQIKALLRRKLTQEQIATDLKVSQSSISREIKRNSGKRGYRHKQAHKKALIRRSVANFGTKKMTPEMTFFIENKMRNIMTPRNWTRAIGGKGRV